MMETEKETERRRRRRSRRAGSLRMIGFWGHWGHFGGHWGEGVPAHVVDPAIAVEDDVLCVADMRSLRPTAI